MSATAWLRRRARITPGAPAVEAGGHRLDWASLEARATRAAACLQRAGIGSDDAVALLLHNGLAWPVLLHAVARCGARLVALNPRLTAAELAPQLRVVRPSLLLHGSELESVARGAASSVGTLVQEVAPSGCPVCGGPVDHEVAARPHATPSSFDTLAVLFTSGTSGPPKAVPLGHASFWWSAHASAWRIGARRDDRWLACMPLFHVGGLSILLRSAILGSAVALHERFDPERVSAALDAGDVTLLSLVPTMLSRLLEFRGPRPVPPGLRAVLLGGAAAPPDLVERARARGLPVLPTYGLTEATSQVATATPGGPAASVGRPLAGTRLRIADPDGRALPAGARGEIQVRGPTVMRGYLGDPAATRAVLRDGWLRTGDLGRLAPDGSLQVLGRRDDVVVSGGENVSPEEVEAALLAHPQVAEAGVAGLPDPDLGRRVAAWVVPCAGARPQPAALRAFCRERLAGYKVPKEVRLAAALPRTAAGKLQRARLVADQPPEPSWKTESLSRQRERRALVSGRVNPSSSDIE